MRRKIKKLKDQLEGARVMRCHTADYHGRYDVGQHSFAMLLVYCALHPNPQQQTMMAIMYHDLHERYIGDIPATTLLGNRTIAKEVEVVEQRIRQKMGIEFVLDEEEARWLWGLDKIEHWLWANRQMLHGNRMIEHHIAWLGGILKNMDLPDELREFVVSYDHSHGRDEMPT